MTTSSMKNACMQCGHFIYHRISKDKHKNKEEGDKYKRRETRRKGGRWRERRRRVK